MAIRVVEPRGREGLLDVGEFFEGDVFKLHVSGGEVDVEIYAEPLDGRVFGFLHRRGEVGFDEGPVFGLAAGDDLVAVVFAAGGFRVGFVAELVRLLGEAFKEEVEGGAIGLVFAGEAVAGVVGDGGYR